VDHLAGGEEGQLGVVAVGDGRAEHGHDPVADELVHRALYLKITSVISSK